MGTVLLNWKSEINGIVILKKAKGCHLKEKDDISGKRTG
jgi:hypothetical protein